MFVRVLFFNILLYILFHTELLLSEKKEALSKTTRYQSGDAGSKNKKNKKQKQKRNAPSKSTELSEEQAQSVPDAVAKETTTIDQSEGSTQKTDSKDAAVIQSGTATNEGGAVEKSVSSENQEVVVVNKIGEAESTYLEEAAEGAKEPSYLKIRKGGFEFIA